ncbi:MAG TPA: peptidoglycan-associated lipoprotein Pal [Desulfomonilia bacterium]|nr:peptidoglycan-associated lipoprotein Pal [Desulfomonilia bacterium]
MERKWLNIFIVIAIGIGLLMFGCAKKPEAEKAEEVKPPVKQEAPQPVPMPEQPKETAMAPAPGMEEQIKEFEDKDIHFDFDKFDLKPEDMDILNNKVAFLKAHPEMKIRIEGNCDERGTIEYNLALGDRRAKTAFNYITEQGIEKDRVGTISYGKERPLDPGHNEEAWAKNRRDHFVITYIKK